MQTDHFELRDLTAAPADLGLLSTFYQSIYVSEFPDFNERESLENMQKYLRLKAEGWYGKNNYHILLYLEDGVPFAASIIDYLAGPNVGVIEFLVVATPGRRTGVGSKLLELTETVLNQDSIRAGYTGWAYVIAEMNDPFKSFEEDSMDPFERPLVWDRWGYKKTQFPYVQPSLSPEKEPVENLLLMCKPGETVNPNAIPAQTLKEAVYGYAIWAMRIDDPDSNRECQNMSRYLAKHSQIGLVPLATYVGSNRSRQLTYTDLASIPLNEIDPLLDIYVSEFSEGPTSFPRDEFKKSLLSRRHEGKSYGYHFLSIKDKPEGPPHGMASFFAFPGAGFGGYVVLDETLRGKGHLSEIITVIERYIVTDRQGAPGWYGECDPADGTAPVFQRRGFYEIAIDYRQPPLIGRPQYDVAHAPLLHLMYKPFGETFEQPRLATSEFLEAMKWLYSVIYRIESPVTSSFFLDLQAQVAHREIVAWKPVG